MLIDVPVTEAAQCGSLEIMCVQYVGFGRLTMARDLASRSPCDSPYSFPSRSHRSPCKTHAVKLRPRNEFKSMLICCECSGTLRTPP
ncbi:uncharacterized [Tachysurus ichikawai]